MAKPQLDAVPAPELNIPPSSVTVLVSIIDTTSILYPPTSMVLEPHIDGHDVLVCPCFSFLITHKGERGTEKLLFDLGMRKDPQNFAPRVRQMLGQRKMTVEKEVIDILDDETINAVIWSHHHFDHIGNMSRFPPETDLVVGPGFKDEFMPGYPSRKDSWILESDYRGRTVQEIDFQESGKGNLGLGGYKAFDYFGDGSFYLLDCPGHSVGHLNALARSTAETFVLMGADCCHHGAELRPNQYLPLPIDIDTESTLRCSGPYRPCPANILDLHPKHSAFRPFYALVDPGISNDIVKARHYLSVLAEFDANDNVLVLFAHDNDIKDILEFWPKTLNTWRTKECKLKLRWAFIKDFNLEKLNKVADDVSTQGGVQQ